MADVVKCRFCKSEIKKEDAYKIGKASYYCDEYCFSKAEERRKDTKNKYSPKENKDRLMLTDYIQELYLNEGYSKSEIPWNMMMSQVKTYQQEYGYKYTGIKLCLEYMVDIKEINLFNENFNGSILNLVPYYYDEAKNNYIEIRNIEKKVENFEFNDEVKVIKKGVDNHKNLWYNKLKINMEEL